MVYYGYSYFYIFFFFFLFFLLILILVSPNYKKKDVVPPLTTQNYAVTFTTTPTTYLNRNTDADAVFQPLRIQDGESGSDGSALDFGGSGADTINVDFSPEYIYKDSSIAGYFVLYLTNNFSPPRTNSSFLFRVRDYENSTTPPATDLSLSEYNYGWTAVNMVAGDSNSLYKVTLPFNLPKATYHNLTVEIAPLNFTGAITDGKIRLNSAYIYYF